MNWLNSVTLVDKVLRKPIKIRGLITRVPHPLSNLSKGLSASNLQLISICSCPRDQSFVVCENHIICGDRASSLYSSFLDKEKVGTIVT